MSDQVDFRMASRKGWSDTPTRENINCGSLQRIADATEKMAASYDDLREDRDRYRLWWSEERDARRKLERQLSATRGVVTKMRREALDLKVQLGVALEVTKEEIHE